MTAHKTPPSRTPTWMRIRNAGGARTVANRDVERVQDAILVALAERPKPRR